MKPDRLKPISLAFLILSAFAQPSGAEILVSETFSYADGDKLDNQDGGTGWTGPWFVHKGQVDTTFEKGRLIVNSKTNSGYSKRTINITAPQNGVLYLCVDLDNQHLPQNPFSVALRTEQGTKNLIVVGQGAGRKYWGVYVTGRGWANTQEPSYAEAKPQRLVLAIDYTSRQVRLYMNPDFSAAEPSNAADAVVSDLDMETLTAFGCVHLVTMNSNPDLINEPRIYDNLFITDSWADFATISDLKASPESK